MQNWSAQKNGELLQIIFVIVWRGQRRDHGGVTAVYREERPYSYRKDVGTMPNLIKKYHVLLFSFSVIL